MENTIKNSIESPVKPPECVGADIYTRNNKHQLCIVDYHRKFLVIKQFGGLNVDDLIKICKIIFVV